MKNPQLISPTTKYKQSFIEAIKEFQKEGLHADLKIEDLQSNFKNYIQGILSQAEGKNLPDGYVAMTRYWLVDGDEYIGRYDIRHSLTESLKKEGGHIGYDIRPSQRRKGYGSIGLKMALEKAKELNLKEILVTCDDTNIGSIKIIEKNGGVFKDKQETAEGKPLKRRYLIQLD